ncbi:uncharacterized protein BDR25DRAFT_353274 [Lindgomyces ingoldianus]|uniref:Uncharacterized protein n=1 Tax=Lindgomyces ingoldianus TaxID=673940 RepID=A0ACB6R1B5_9PLEO|nr:uncharacterized protein BDR25DRAFT_353274 [Lindgomyces ingoldianus]KAF2472966.1 hypothetical protein BDR25DRAFT_353274 [Lindgomyces ingoldianus]
MSWQLRWNMRRFGIDNFQLCQPPFVEHLFGLFERQTMNAQGHGPRVTDLSRFSIMVFAIYARNANEVLFVLIGKPIGSKRSSSAEGATLLPPGSWKRPKLSAVSLPLSIEQLDLRQGFFDNKVNRANTPQCVHFVPCSITPKFTHVAFSSHMRPTEFDPGVSEARDDLATANSRELPGRVNLLTIAPTPSNLFLELAGLDRFSHRGLLLVSPPLPRFSHATISSVFTWNILPSNDESLTLKNAFIAFRLSTSFCKQHVAKSCQQCSVFLALQGSIFATPIQLRNASLSEAKPTAYAFSQCVPGHNGPAFKDMSIRWDPEKNPYLASKLQ